jgi:Reverse transcriptase (RNA-dependent DNA polymerase)
VDELIEELGSSGNGCHINKIFFGCIMYADDIILLSPSVIGLQCMLDICFEFGAKHDIIFNSKKSVCLLVGVRDSDVKCNMFLGGNELLWVSKLKYLGVYFIAKRDLVDVIPIKFKFYAALNSLLCKCKLAAEPVELQLIKSFCLPLLSDK